MCTAQQLAPQNMLGSTLAFYICDLTDAPDLLALLGNLLFRRAIWSWLLWKERFTKERIGSKQTHINSQTQVYIYQETKEYTVKPASPFGYTLICANTVNLGSTMLTGGFNCVEEIPWCILMMSEIEAVVTS